MGRIAHDHASALALACSHASVPALPPALAGLFLPLPLPSVHDQTQNTLPIPAKDSREDLDGGGCGESVGTTFAS